MVDFEYAENYGMDDFRRIVALLRGEGGCPWDREQTHESIRRNVLEEACEVCEAIDEKNPEHLREELGDLLLQVVFHAQMEQETGGFTFDDIVDAACKKLIFRHPHVFGSKSVSSAEEALESWDSIKRIEKAQATTADAMEAVAKTLPSLWRAEKIQKKAAKAGLETHSADELSEKAAELLAALSAAPESIGGNAAFSAIGDLIFTAVGLSRLVGIDPEEAVHAACGRYTARIRELERERDSKA